METNKVNRILMDDTDLSPEVTNDLISIGETPDRELVYLNLNQNTIITGKVVTGKTTILRMIAQKIRKSNDIPLTIIHSKTTLKQAYSALTKLEKNKTEKHILIVDDLEELITIKDADSFTMIELKKKIKKKLFNLFIGTNNDKVKVIYGSGFYSKTLHKEYIEDFNSGTIVLLSDSRMPRIDSSKIRQLGTAIFKNPTGVFLQKDNGGIKKSSENLIEFVFFKEQDDLVPASLGSLIF